MTRILNINPEGVNKDIFNSPNYEIDNFSFPSISFNPAESSDFNIDAFISKKVINQISVNDYDVIIIPVSLTANFLELVGLRVAYHIRLTSSSNQFKPIIFLCDFGLNELLKLDNLCQFLFSDFCYLSKTNVDSVLNLLKSGRIKKLKEDDFKFFVNKINFTAPDSYLSNHSVANEWGISRWADILNVNDSKIGEVKENIESLLYFKYLFNKYPPSVANPVSYSCTGRGKVVYIDDEWHKGWKSVLHSFFSFSPAIRFLVLEEVFKDKTSADIVTMVTDYIVREDPDLIILDLRLNDNDFNHDKLSLFTGYSILQGIKALNPGFQVIVFSATSKIWNLLELQKIGANGFILKEAPDLNVETNYAKRSISKFKDDVEEGLRKSKHRCIWRRMNKVKGAVAYNHNNFLSESAVSIDIAWSLIEKDNLNYAYLTLYQAIEKHGEIEWQSSDSSIRDSSGAIIKIVEVVSPLPTYSATWKLKYMNDVSGSYFKIENKTVTKEKNISALVKISAICAFRLGKNDQYLQKIGVLNKLRNDIAHEGKVLNRYPEIEFLLDLLYDIRNTTI